MREQILKFCRLNGDFCERNKTKRTGVLGNMNESWNPEIPLDLQQNFKKEKEQAFTLYLEIGRAHV